MSNFSYAKASNNTTARALTVPCSAIFSGAGGTINVVLEAYFNSADPSNTSGAISFVSVPAGTVLPVAARYIVALPTNSVILWS